MSGRVGRARHTRGLRLKGRGILDEYDRKKAEIERERNEHERHAARWRPFVNALVVTWLLLFTLAGVAGVVALFRYVFGV